MSTAMMPGPLVELPLPTPFGEFTLAAFDCDGREHVAMLKGDVSEGAPLCRIHSECLTGDTLGSLRCDCGPQLRTALRRIADEGRGIVVYMRGHEGRGIGLLAKLRAYVLQDGGLDTVDANRHLGLPVDARDYGDAAEILRRLGVASVRLLSSNPEKAHALERCGVTVEEVLPLQTAVHANNRGYLTAKRDRLGHALPVEAPVHTVQPVDVILPLLGAVADRGDRPYVVLKYAQTLDGRIATATGDSRWISCVEERRLSHTLRAAVDAVLVGAGTVLSDDPRLTVRLVAGASPMRVVLDSRMQIAPDAAVLGEDGCTVVFTTSRAPAARVDAIRASGGVVRVVAERDGHVDLRAALTQMRELGIRSLLVEGGAEVLTSFVAFGLADRIVVSISPMLLGAGREAIGELRRLRIADATLLRDPVVRRAGRDLVVAGDLAPGASPTSNGHPSSVTSSIASHPTAGG